MLTNGAIFSTRSDAKGTYGWRVVGVAAPGWLEPPACSSSVEPWLPERGSGNSVDNM